MNQARQRYGLSASDLSPGQLAVIFPVFHLLMSTIFIWAYCSGFGLNISIFVSTGDIFTFALSSMIPVYLTSFLLPILWTGIRYARPHPFAQDKVESIQDEGERREAFQNLQAARRVILWAVVLVCALIAATSLWAYYHDHLILYPALGLIPGVMLMFALTRAKEVWSIDDLTYEAATVVGLFAIACVTFGLFNGQIDRRTQYKANADHYFKCNGQLVIRKLGETFLVVRPDNSKAIVDAECKTLFTADMPRPKPAKTPS